MPGLSKHELDNFAIAPSYYQWRKKQDWKPSKSMILGTLVHSLALENREEFAIGPAVDKRTKAGKDEWQLFCENNIGKEIVTEEEARRIYGAVSSCKNLLDDIQWKHVEASMFWDREGIACKGRPDLIGRSAQGACIVDIKTTEDIARFDSKFFAFRYHVQAAWYKHGIEQITGEKHDFLFLAVDMQEPHLSQFIVPSSDVMEEADCLIEQEMENFKEASQSNQWPGLPTYRILMGRAQ